MLYALIASRLAHDGEDGPAKLIELPCEGITVSVGTVSFTYEGVVHSPFNGQPSELDDEDNCADPTLLFTWYGDSGLYGYISVRLADRLPEDVHDLEPLELAERLRIDNLVVFVVNANWGGINYYCYAPADDEADAS